MLETESDVMSAAWVTGVKQQRGLQHDSLMPCTDANMLHKHKLRSVPQSFALQYSSNPSEI